MKKLFLIVTAISIIGLSCSKEETVKLKDNPYTKKESADIWKNSKAKAHPYNLANIFEAQRELGSTLKSAKELTLYKYVCFKPDTSEQKILFQDSTIKLYELPLADPKLYSWKNYSGLKSAVEEDTTRKPVYAILPLDKAMPKVRYTVLDTLYFPDFDSEKDLYFAAHILAGTIKVDSAAIDSMPGSNLKSTQGWGWLKKAVKWAVNVVVGYEPTGTLAVNGNRIEGANVEVIAWGLPYSGRTDANGYFHINKSIHVLSVVYLTFENEHCKIKLWNLETRYSINNIMGTARYYIGDKVASDLSGMGLNLDNNSYGGMCATIINAVEKYHQQASTLGIGTPPKVNIAAIWGKKFSSGAGSAPMFNYLTNPVSQSSYFTDILVPLLSITNDYYNPFSSLTPDIIIPQTTGFDFQRQTSTLLHELTHAAHAAKVGKVFWTRVVTGELNNMRNKIGPYGKRSSEFSGAVGLAEAWANDVENIMMYKWFGNAGYYISSQMENIYNKSNKDAVNNWLPNGLFYDLFDTNGLYGAYESYEITDIISGISYSSLYSNFSGSLDNLTDYKNRLKISFPSKATDIEALFNQYSL